MEHYDPGQVTRVWQRVWSEGTEKSVLPGLKALAAAEITEAALLKRLSAQLGDGGVLLKMSREDAAHGECIKGIYIMATGEHPELKPYLTETEKPETALRKCYVRKLRAIAQYESRAGDADYGSAFSWLARQEEEHCCRILQLMGRLKK